MFMTDGSCNTGRSSGSNPLQVWVGTHRSLIGAQRNSLLNATCLLVKYHHVECKEYEDRFVETAVRRAMLGKSERVQGING